MSGSMTIQTGRCPIPRLWVLPGWIAIIAMFGFLASAIIYSVHAWGLLAGVGMSPLGWLFLVLGVILTVAVGAGLMALLFYSSRKGKDF